MKPKEIKMSVFRIYACLDGEVEHVDVLEAKSKKQAEEYGLVWAGICNKFGLGGGNWSIAVEKVS